MSLPGTYLNRPVYSLQTMLRQIAMVDPRILPCIPNGVYGPGTAHCVRSFQEANGLPVTGETDLATWNRIAAVHSQVQPLLQPLQSPLRRSPAQILRPGDQNAHLRLVQAMLQALACCFSGLRAPDVTGVLDPATEAGLSWVQKAAGLPENGCLDPASWNALNRIYRAVIGDGVSRQDWG